MPQIDVFASRKDQIAFAEFILSRGASLVPMLFYETSRYRSIATLAEFKSIHRTAGHFLITHPAFTTRKIEILDVDRKEGLRYFLDPRGGGPSLQWVTPGNGVMDRKKLIGSDTFSHYGWYWNEKRGIQEKPPKELVNFYRALVRLIQNDCANVSTKIRTYWATDAAVQMRRKGFRFVGIDY